MRNLASLALQLQKCSEQVATFARSVASVLRAHELATVAAAASLALTSAPADAQISPSPYPDQTIKFARPATSGSVVLHPSDGAGSPNYMLSYYVASQPAHGSVSFGKDCGTGPDKFGQFTCTVTYLLASPGTYIGSDSFGLSICDNTDGKNPCVPVSVSETIYPAPPTANNVGTQTTDKAPTTVDLLAGGYITVDPSVSPKLIVVSVTTAPVHGAATVSGTQITYQPSGKYVGSDSLTYTVSDGSTSTASAVMTIAVQPSSAVTAANFPVQDTDNAALAIDLTQNNRITFDPNDLSRLKVTVTAAPAHGSTSAAGTTITYTPNAGYIGNDALSYQVSDGFTSASGTISIRVKPSAALTASNFSVQDTNNAALAINLTQNSRITFDPNDLGHLNVSVTAEPAHGTTSTNGTTITYTLTAPFIGLDRLTYQVSDGNTSATGMITIMVRPRTALTATSFSVQATDGAPFAIDLTQKNRIAFDPADASHLTVAVTSSPAHGTARASGTTITYTGASGYTGGDKLTYQVSDGFTSASGTISIADTPQRIPIPANVIGKPQATAMATLTTAGFMVTTVSQISTTVPYGDVITTLPAPGTLVLPRTVVKLFVSQGIARQANAPLSSVPGLTPGEASVAQALERACASIGGAIGNGVAVTPQQRDLYTQCSALISDYGGGQNPAGLKKALDAISGRQITAPQRTALQFSAGQLANMSARLSELRHGGASFSMAGLDLGLPGAVSAASGPLLGLAKELFGGGAGDEKGGPGSRLGMFITGTFRRGSQSTSDSELGFDFKNDGVTAGMDYRFTDRLILGLAGGYGTTTSTFDDEGSRLHSKNTGISLYGTYFRDRYYFDVLAGFIHNSYDLSRQTAFQSSSNGVGCGSGNCSIETNSSTTAHEWTVSGATGIDFGSGGLAVGPELALDYARIDVAGFVEGGPSGLALSFSPESAESLVLKAGGHVTYAWTTSWAVISPQARVRWLHEFLNSSYAAPVVFTADTLTPVAQRGFVVYTNSPDRNYLAWNLSVAFQFPYGISGFVNYGQLGGLQYTSMREFNIGLRVENRFW
jgi:uncharacterized protein YhjY with autotransporter beta-barrel domain